MTRTSILLDDDQLQQLKRRAMLRGTTVTNVIREAVASYLAGADPNVGLRPLIGLGHSDRTWPPVDSDEANAAFLADLEFATFSRCLPEIADTSASSGPCAATSSIPFLDQRS